MKKSEVITSYKGFDSNMQCRGYQFKVGDTFTHAGATIACESGFHACEYPLDVLQYYPPATSQYAVVEQSGTIARHSEDSKVASSVLTVKASIGLPGLIQAAIEYTISRSKPEGEKATGDRGAASATGNRGAASATGDSGAASATGDSGAASATGYRGAASATGKNSRAMGTKGNALFLVERDDAWNIIAVGAAIVGKTRGVKADTWYTLVGGKFVEAKS